MPRAVDVQRRICSPASGRHVVATRRQLEMMPLTTWATVDSYARRTADALAKSLGIDAESIDLMRRGFFDCVGYDDAGCDRFSWASAPSNHGGLTTAVDANLSSHVRRPLLDARQIPREFLRRHFCSASDRADVI